MNEIKKCSIAGVSFTLENDAYDALSTYIETLKQTYRDDPDGEEIIADIEARIAELILSAQTAEAIICRPLVDNIIKQLGSASQIDEEHAEQHHQAETTDHNGNPRIPRRLYRDLQHGKLGGVCAGLATYFDADPTWIRLGMFAPLFLWVFGTIGPLRWIIPFTGNLFVLFVLGYIIMWFAVPPASSARQKLEMKGERITAKSIKNATQTQPTPEEPERTLVADIFRTLGNILLILLKIVTVFLLIGLVFGTSLLVFVAVCSIPLMAFDLATGLAILCFMAVIIIPMIVLIYLSILLLLSRRPNGKFLLVTVLIWLMTLISMTIAALKSPASFSSQIENTFEAAFSNRYEKLFDEFSDDEIEEFRKKIDSKSTAMFTNGEFSFSISGDKGDVERFSNRVEIGPAGISVSDGDGNTLKIGDDGIRINDTKTENFSFSFGGVTVSIRDDSPTVTDTQAPAAAENTADAPTQSDAADAAQSAAAAPAGE